MEGFKRTGEYQKRGAVAIYYEVHRNEDGTRVAKKIYKISRAVRVGASVSFNNFVEAPSPSSAFPDGEPTVNRQSIIPIPQEDNVSTS